MALWPLQPSSVSGHCVFSATAHTNYETPPHHLTHLPSISYVTILSSEHQLPHLYSQSYASILIKNKWLVLIGTKGSFKTMIASHLLRHLSSKLFNSPERYILFNMDSEGTQVGCVGGGREERRGGEVSRREKGRWHGTELRTSLDLHCLCAP